MSLGPRTARAAAPDRPSRSRRKKRDVRDPLDRGSARVCDLIDIILRRWGHGPSLYLLRRHPGPPSETKGARASGVGGGGFNDPLLACAFSRCRVPGTLGSVGTWPRLPGLSLGAAVQLANIPLFVRPSTGYQPKPATAGYRTESLSLAVQAKRAEAATDVKLGRPPGPALLLSAQWLAATS